MRLVYLSPVPWSSFAQRPHFMVRYFLRQGFQEVVWVDPYPGRLPKWQDFHRSKSLHDQGTPIEPGLKIIKPRFAPIDPLPGGYWLNSHLSHRRLVDDIKNRLSLKECILGIGKPSSLAVDLLTSLRGHTSFYDAMDDFPQFYEGLSRKSFQRNEEILVDNVGRVFCSSNALYRKFESYRKKLMLICNAFDETVFVGPRKRRRMGSPVIGYIGSLGGWFDWKLTCHLASVANHCEFRLIGPQLAPIPSNLPSNITILPPCRHDKVSDHLATFDVGLIPFKVNGLTESVDPIKYYEYRAMGLPIITTKFGQMKCRGEVRGVYFADENSDMKTIENALRCELSEKETEIWRSENSWTHRFQEVVKCLLA